MEHIARQLSTIERNIKIRGADNATRGGFTMVPNFALKSNAISPGAKLAYSMLLHYAWQNDYCFPGQDRLAADMGVVKRSVVSYLQELERAAFIVVERRGQGKSNMYELILKPARRKS
ncbi:MAG TPA: helix-turn-helix domain-containing protein [Hyphomicrobiaceae bacterium]|nr:helix-turn-helix domain-containing protein [Hyphomicrobiaceae bacterium]